MPFLLPSSTSDLNNDLICITHNITAISSTNVYSWKTIYYIIVYIILLKLHIFKVGGMRWYPPDWFLYWIFSDWCQCVPTEMESGREECEEIFWTWGNIVQRLKVTNPSSFDDWSSFHGWISKINCHPWTQQKQARQPEGQRSFWVWKLCVVTVRWGREGMTFVKLKESPS